MWLTYNGKLVLLRALSRRVTVQSSSQMSTTSTMYKRWQYDQFTEDVSAATLHESQELPQILSPNSVLVEVKAASVNPIDVLMARGYGQKIISLMRFGSNLTTSDKSYGFPLTLGHDFSGVVVNKGAKVSDLNIGDKVWGVIPIQDTGSHATHVITHDSHLARRPTNITDIEAASIPFAALTAHKAIVLYGGINPNNANVKNVLVLGGTGGVGTLAVQILKAWGATVTATCSAGQEKWLKDLTGVDRVIDYKSNELDNLKEEYDMVLDAAPPQDPPIHEDALASLKKTNTSRYVTLNPPFLNNFDSKGLVLGGLANLCDAVSTTYKGMRNGKILLVM